MPEPNTELIVPVLINGAVFATVAVIVPAFLLSRFTRDIVGLSVLVIFLFIAAGVYFGFATSGRKVLGTGQVWMLVELVQVVGFGTLALLGLLLSVLACCGMGVASLLGRCASLRRTGTPVYSLDLCDCVCQFRLAGCPLYRHRLRAGWGPQAEIPRGRYCLAEKPLVI